MHICSGKLTIEIQISILIGSFSKCWFIHNTREFLIVFISNALFAKCLVFAVQMTFASRYFTWNTLCVNCETPRTVQRSITVFLRLGYYTYALGEEEGIILIFTEAKYYAIAERYISYRTWERTAKDTRIGNYVGDKGEFNLNLTLPRVNKNHFGKKN